VNVKTRGCIWCDMLRKGSRKVKLSRNPAVHWVLKGEDRKSNEFVQKPCRKETFSAPDRRV
jgi:hypothetical protein